MQYLIACESTSAADGLQVLAGSNSGQFAAFPVLPVCGGERTDGAGQKKRDGTDDDMEVEEGVDEEGEISGWKIGSALSVFDGKHADVVRDVLSTRCARSGETSSGAHRSNAWSCGEDGMVCRWAVEG